MPSEDPCISIWSVSSLGFRSNSSARHFKQNKNQKKEKWKTILFLRPFVLQLDAESITKATQICKMQTFNLRQIFNC